MRLYTALPAAQELAVSIHAPREGCDGLCGVALNDALDVSIHAPREGCDVIPRELIADAMVSIHAPREGCDVPRGQRMSGCRMVSIHAPREGCDEEWQRKIAELGEFQFTHPVRGATSPRHSPTSGGRGFNSRTP